MSFLVMFLVSLVPGVAAGLVLRKVIDSKLLSVFDRSLDV